MEPVIVLEHHYGKDVWTNVALDDERRKGCLCRSCAFLRHDDDNCAQAEVLYALCRTTGMAVAVTRCRDYSPIGGR